MLRESARTTNTQIDLNAVTDDNAGDGDEARLNDARRRVREALGDSGFIDASAVIANYSALDRVADATGIPLEAAKEANTVELRTELGINDFARKKDRFER